MKNLVILRERKGYSRKQMAQFLNVTIQAYSRYENDQREPSIEMLKKISAVLGTSLDLLLDIQLIKSTFEIEIHKLKYRSRVGVKIVKSEPHLSRTNTDILENYFSLLIDRVDFSKKDIESQIKEVIAKRLSKIS